MSKKKDTKPRGRPKSAVASDAQSILDKANWEMSKFDAKVANNMGKILDEYFNMAFDDKLKENTRLTVLKDLIKMQKENIAAVEAVEPHEKPRTQEGEEGDDDEDDDIDMGNILSVDFEDKKTG